MISSNDLCTHIIKPTLLTLARYNPKMYSKTAIKLLMGTAAQESDLGYWVKQITGPAVSIYQIEPATHYDVTSRYLKDKPKLQQLVVGMVSQDRRLGDDEELITNLRYATAICRIRYWMEPDALPDPQDLVAIAKYWDTHYNANPYYGTVEEFMESWTKFLSDWEYENEQEPRGNSSVLLPRSISEEDT